MLLKFPHQHQLGGYLRETKYSDQQGFTLVETMVSLVIFLAVLGGLLPVLVTSRISALENNIETGAIAVSQQILDRLRQVDVTTLPNAGSTTEVVQFEQTGNNYRATINYCQNAAFCDANSRHIQVSIDLDGNPDPDPVYEVETVYTRFE